MPRGGGMSDVPGRHPMNEAPDALATLVIPGRDPIGAEIARRAAWHPRSLVMVRLDRTIGINTLVRAILGRTMVRSSRTMTMNERCRSIGDTILAPMGLDPGIHPGTAPRSGPGSTPGMTRVAPRPDAIIVGRRPGVPWLTFRRCVPSCAAFPINPSVIS
jgi:hypothetical protein